MAATAGRDLLGLDCVCVDALDAAQLRALGIEAFPSAMADQDPDAHGARINPIIEADAFNRSARTEYARQLGCEAGGALRDLVLTGWRFVGREALPVRPDLGVCLYGQSIGWGEDYLHWYVASRLRGVSVPQERRVHVPGLSAAPAAVIDDVTLFACPGFDVFGHWLLDFAPRLFLETSRPDRRTLAFPTLPDWAADLLEAYELDADCPIPDRGVCAGDRVRIPAFPKSGVALREAVCEDAWADLRTRFAPAGGTANADRVFISREGWPRSERLGNRSELYTMLERRGFQIVKPELLDRAAQIRLFESASIIAGEDGSGMHNTVFSNPGSTVIVVGENQPINFWHASVSSIRRQRIAYGRIQRRAHEPAGEVDLAGLEALIEALG